MTVVMAAALAPSVGIAAIPIAFTLGSAVKVGLLVVALAARLAASGRLNALSWGPPR